MAKVAESESLIYIMTEYGIVMFWIEPIQKSYIGEIFGLECNLFKTRVSFPLE